MAAFPAPASGVVPTDQLVLRAAASAFLGRYRGQTRVHTESDLRIFLRWCTDHDLDPLAVARADAERYVRWLQDVRRYQPSTVSRRLSVVVGFYRVCVIDAILDHSPADYVRRPTVPAESPTLGLGHLQFEALITTARLSTNPNDFALVALLGLLGLRIFEACGASIADLGEEHGHRGTARARQGWQGRARPAATRGGPSHRPGRRRPHHRADPSQHPRGADGPTRGNPPTQAPGGHCRDTDAKDAPAHAAPHLRHNHARRWREPARRADRRPSRRSADDHALRPRPQEPWPAPEVHPRRRKRSAMPTDPRSLRSRTD